MAKLIVKSPYLKCGGAEKVSGYLHYIGTREHDAWSAARDESVSERGNDGELD